MTADCLFCNIVEGKVPAVVVHDSAEVLGFRDANPQAPVHVLFVPKRHVAGAHALEASNAPVMGSLFLAAKAMAEKLGVGESGYRLVVNSRRDAGQTVDHLHLHLLGGRKMVWPPG